MFKVDRVKSSFNCDECHKLLVDPVAMPCDNIICKAHLDKLLTNKSNNENIFICGVCQEEHLVPKNGFVVNSRLKNLLELELNTLFETNPAFEECKKELEQAKENVKMIEEFETNAEVYIYEYFEDIKIQVDLRREVLKQKIDDHSDEIIKSLELNQQNYTKLSKEVNLIELNIERSKKKLNDLVAQFDTLEFNGDKFKEIKASVAVLNLELHQIIGEYHDSLVGNKKYTFQIPTIEVPIKSLFGYMTDYYIPFNSQ
jgi:hypothetical protein